MPFGQKIIRLVTLLCVLTMVGCAANGDKPGFSFKSLGKTDIDMVTDHNRAALDKLIEELTIKLYKRNPRELKKARRATVELRLKQILSPAPQEGYPELNGAIGSDALRLVFSDQFKGDRVFAMMFGLNTMIDASYNHKKEFFILDELDAQKLYNSARNIESISWQLNNMRRTNGIPYLYANGLSKDGIMNVSYERVLAKMIALQDMMSTIIADSSNRQVKNVIHNAASMVFLPI